jgi:hypothetical protein
MNDSLQPCDHFRETTLELRRRWKVALSTLGVSAIQLVDLVALADPEFECEIPPPSGADKLRGRLERLDVRFRRFPTTSQLLSPYETLLDLHARGCKLLTEHRIIDIWSPAGEMLGGVAGMIPWQQGTNGPAIRAFNRPNHSLRASDCGRSFVR